MKRSRTAAHVRVTEDRDFPRNRAAGPTTLCRRGRTAETEFARPASHRKYWPRNLASLIETGARLRWRSRPQRGLRRASRHWTNRQTETPIRLAVHPLSLRWADVAVNVCSSIPSMPFLPRARALSLPALVIGSPCRGAPSAQVPAGRRRRRTSRAKHRHSSSRLPAASITSGAT